MGRERGGAFVEKVWLLKGFCTGFIDLTGLSGLSIGVHGDWMMMGRISWS